jgi:hypothetical protein
VVATPDYDDLFISLRLLVAWLGESYQACEKQGCHPDLS